MTIRRSSRVTKQTPEGRQYQEDLERKKQRKLDKQKGKIQSKTPESKSSNKRANKQKITPLPFRRHFR